MKGVQMTVSPSHGDLYDPVEFPEAHVVGDKQATPDSGTDILQGYLELKHVFGGRNPPRGRGFSVWHK